VALPLYDGELGVLPGRSPLIGRLGYGELRTTKGDLIGRYFVDGGFAQVRDNVVTILTQRAIPVQELDPTATAHALESLESHRAITEHDRAERDKAVARARGMIRAARHRS
jgi:F-type H+-transporting ATPase subunit epsilon